MSYYLYAALVLTSEISTCVLSHVQLFATLWTAAPQAPLSMGFPRQEHWSGLPFPPPTVNCSMCPSSLECGALLEGRYWVLLLSRSQDLAKKVGDE